MRARTPVFVHAPDPVSQAGLVAQLRTRPGIAVVDDLGVDDAEVAVISLESVDEEALRIVRAVQRNGCPQVLVLVHDVDEAELCRLVELGVAGVLRRADASAERLDECIGAVRAGGASLPPDLVGGLLRQLKAVQDEVLAPHGLHFHGLSDREVEVLRLVAAGYDTREIADQLCYSARTIKNVIHDVVRRFGLRNRSHAVAYALRQGLI